MKEFSEVTNQEYQPFARQRFQIFAEATGFTFKQDAVDQPSGPSGGRRDFNLEAFRNGDLFRFELQSREFDFEKPSKGLTIHIPLRHYKSIADYFVSFSASCPKSSGIPERKHHCIVVMTCKDVFESKRVKVECRSKMIGEDLFFDVDARLGVRFIHDGTVWKELPPDRLITRRGNWEYRPGLNFECRTMDHIKRKLLLAKASCEKGEILEASDLGI